MDYLNSFVNIVATPPKTLVSYSYLVSRFRKGVPDAYQYTVPEQGSYCLTLNFLKHNAMPGTLKEVDGSIGVISVDFPNHLPVNVCEDVYQTLVYWRPIGVSLVTNRTDLFGKLKEAETALNELESKKHKLQKKLAKVERKIEELIKEMEV